MTILPCSIAVTATVRSEEAASLERRRVTVHSSHAVG
jgi:hypothetical protein